MLSAAHTMLSLLFICIELLPVLVKILLNFGPPTAYDRLAALRDRGDVAVEEIEQEARRTVEQARNEMLVMAELERLERQKDVILERQRALEYRRAEDARRAAAARDALGAEAPADTAGEENVRRPWDTGPILTAARTAAARTMRTVTRRTADREAMSA
jgi:pyruvate-formate lyase